MLTTDEVRQALDQVIDPELGVPITDLGLVYEVDVDVDRVRIVMTTTTPICPLGSYLQQQVERRLTGHEVDVELVHEPLWAPEMMNERARRALGWECGPLTTKKRRTGRPVRPFSSLVKIRR